MNEKKDFQLKLISETARRLEADGNADAASCLYCIASAMAVGAESIVAIKLLKTMKELLHEAL